MNYYIVEADLSEDEIKKRIESDGGKQDQWGTGINRKTYFVCNCLGDEWTELPKLTSKDIEISQKIRKYFTGDLNATVRSNPQFTGNEKNLLRAVIQRITTETYAAPVGYYNVVEGIDFVLCSLQCFIFTFNILCKEMLQLTQVTLRPNQLNYSIYLCGVSIEWRIHLCAPKILRIQYLHGQFVACRKIFRKHQWFSFVQIFGQELCPLVQKLNMIACTLVGV